MEPRGETYQERSDADIRDPERIDKILENLKAVWLQVPDRRLGQLVVNISKDRGHIDPFFLEDDELLSFLKLCQVD